MTNEPSPSKGSAEQHSTAGKPAQGGSPPAHQEASLFESPPGEWFSRWHRTPLYLRILGAVVLGLIVGLILGPWARPLEIPSKLVLRLLGALAAPLILLAVIQALMHAEIPRGSGTKLLRLLALNTLVAIGIGLLVANVMQPGRWTQLDQDQQSAATAVSADESRTTGKPAPQAELDATTHRDAPAAPAAEQEESAKSELLKKMDENLKEIALFLENVPKSFLGPLGDEGKVISVILLALALGVALRRVKQEKVGTVAEAVAIGFNVLIVILHWIIAVIPLAVFGIVASIVGTQGFAAFARLGAFVLAVLIALSLQLTYYLVRIRFFSWARPWDVIRGMRDALVMAFSTASSTATMPVTYACLREKVKLRERSASLGALVGANFNNDGTALYEAMAALFIAQLTGVELTLLQQFVIVLTSVAASVGAAGIPEAGIVTMTAVLSAVHLDVTFIPVLLTVDWFLDRCRTAVNVMGDVNVSCILDGKTREEAADSSPVPSSA